jgi:cytochrome c6
MKLDTANSSKVFVLLLAAAVLIPLALNARPAVGAAAAQRGGGAVYSQNCARCHGVDGRAQTRKGREVEATDFTGEEWSPETGRDTRIVTRGKGSMPAFGRKLSQAQIRSVVQYIRRFKR